MHQRAMDVRLMPEIQRACVVDLGKQCSDQVEKGEVKVTKLHIPPNENSVSYSLFFSIFLPTVAIPLPTGVRILLPEIPSRLGWPPPFLGVPIFRLCPSVLLPLHCPQLFSLLCISFCTHWRSMQGNKYSVLNSLPLFTILSGEFF